MEIVLKPAKPGPIWRFFSSMWLAIGLMLWVGIVCALGTFADLKEAEVIFFKTRWFGIMLGVLMLNIFIATLNRASKPLYTSAHGFRFPWKISQIPFILVHIGLLLTFGAKIVTASYLIDGQLRLSEGQPTDDRLPPQTDNRVYLSKRKIEAELIVKAPEKGLPNLQDCHIQCLTKSGKFKRGYVLSFAKNGASSTIQLNHGDHVDILKQSDIDKLVVHDAAPLHLSYLPETKDLQAGRPNAFWVGLLASGVFVALAFVLGHYLDAKVAPLISVFVMAALASALYLELPEYKTKLVGDDLKITYKRYVPHAMPYTEIKHDPAQAENRAMQFYFEGRKYTLFQNQQAPGTAVDGRQPLVAPLESKQFQLNYITVADRQEREALFANSQGTITITSIADPSETLTLSDDQIAGKTFKVGDVEIEIQEVYKGFVIVKNDSAAPGAPKQIAKDRGTLSNPAVKYRIKGEPNDRFYFAWHPESNKELQREFGESKLASLVYKCPQKLQAPSLNFIETRGEETGELVVLEEGKAPVVYKIEPDIPMEPMFAGNKLEVELLEFIPNAVVRNDFKNLTAEDKTNFKDFQDAVLVEAEFAGKKAEGWLRFGIPLRLDLGENVLTLNYDFQVHMLDFAIKLTDFNVEFHPGSTRESGFRSKVVVIDESEDTKIEKSADIFMNNTLDYAGYRFFQSSYQKVAGQPDSSIFSVARDPGTPVFYAGCIILCFGVFVIFFVKPSLIKIEKRFARIAAGLPAEGPITKEQKIAAAAAIKAKHQAAAAAASSV